MITRARVIELQDGERIAEARLVLTATGVNPVALQDALGNAVRALDHAEAGNGASADAALWEANAAAPEAFPEGDRRAAALALILAEVSAAVREQAA